MKACFCSSVPRTFGDSFLPVPAVQHKNTPLGEDAQLVQVMLQEVRHPQRFVFSVHTKKGNKVRAAAVTSVVSIRC
jgi:hypothetical protein